MRCWDARQHVSDYVDGLLADETTRVVEAHLETCPTCPPLYAALVDAHDHMSQLRDSDTVIPGPGRADPPAGRMRRTRAIRSPEEPLR